MKIGALERLVIFVVILFVIGPDKLPLYARKFGNAMREFRKASADVTQEIRESVIDPLEEAQAPLREAMEPLEDLDRSLKADVRGMKDDLEGIGKPSAKKPAAAETKEAPAGSAADGQSGSTPQPDAEENAIEENGGDAP